MDRDVSNPGLKEWDIFVSYCRFDNEPRNSHQGRVSAVIERLKACHLESHPGEELRVFFDCEAITVGEDWRARLLEGLRGSHYMIAFLSDNYVSPEHPNCSWEWDTFERFERKNGLYGEAIAPIFFVSKSDGHEREAAEQRVCKWLGQRRWRNDLKLGEACWRNADAPFMPLESAGSDALDSDAVRMKLAALDAEIVRKREMAEQVRASPTTVHSHNPNFAGRDAELQKLRKTLLERPAVVTNGLGGVGKTALACEYAHVFAHVYPGGRYWVPCEGRKTLEEALLQLGSTQQAGESVTGLVWEANTSQVERVAMLRRWLRRNVPCVGTKLLILDNVDTPDHLRLVPGEESLLPGHPHVHVLATSREGVRGVVQIPLDELSDAEGVEVMRRYCAADEARPGIRPKRELPEADLGVVREIVRDLGGFTLAVEAVAVHLAEKPEVTLVGFLDQLRANGAGELDRTAAKDHIALSLHRQKLLSLTLKPTIDSLTPVERDALNWAISLPTESVPLAWVRELLVRAYPEVSEPPVPGREDEHLWSRVVKRLESLRLLVPEREEFRQGEMPYVAHYHRLIGDILRRDSGFPNERRDAVWTYVCGKLPDLYKQVHHKEVRSWIDALRGMVWKRSADSSLVEVAVAANDLALVEWHSGYINEAKKLLLKAISTYEKTYKTDHPDLADCYSNLAMLEKDIGNLNEAKQLLQHTVTIHKKLCAPDDLEFAKDYSDLAIVEMALGNLNESKVLLLEAISIEQKANEQDDASLARNYSYLAMVEKDLGHLAEAKKLFLNVIAAKKIISEPNHPTLAISYSNLAMVEQALGNLSEAKDLLLKAIAIEEKFYEFGHPTLAISYSNLAMVERVLGNLDVAKNWLLKAIVVDEKFCLQDHPSQAQHYSNLAVVERALGHLHVAKDLHLKAIAIDENNYESDHPTLAKRYSNLAIVEQALGNNEQACILMQRAYDILHKRGLPEAMKAAAWLAKKLQRWTSDETMVALDFWSLISFACF